MGVWVLLGWLACGFLARLLDNGCAWEAWQAGEPYPDDGRTLCVVGGLISLGCILPTVLRARVGPCWSWPPCLPYESADAAIARLERELLALDTQWEAWVQSRRERPHHE